MAICLNWDLERERDRQRDRQTETDRDKITIEIWVIILIVAVGVKQPATTIHRNLRNKKAQNSREDAWDMNEYRRRGREGERSSVHHGKSGDVLDICWCATVSNWHYKTLKRWPMTIIFNLVQGSCGRQHWMFRRCQKDIVTSLIPAPQRRLFNVQQRHSKDVFWTYLCSVGSIYKVNTMVQAQNLVEHHD